MTRLTQCDDCGLYAEGDETYWYINRNADGATVTGHLCDDCMPEELKEMIPTNTFDTGDVA